MRSRRLFSPSMRAGRSKKSGIPVPLTPPGAFCADAWTGSTKTCRPAKRRVWAGMKPRRPGLLYSPRMSDWLLKTEPSDYSFEDLVKEKKTVWTGVKNPVARKHLSSMKKNDRIVVYHTGDVKAAVGLAAVAADARPDPKDPASPLVEIEASKSLSKAVSLADMK